MNTMNFTVRRVLELNMVYNNQARYQEINQLALNIFTERLKNKNLSPSRSIYALIEVVYHYLKALEVDSEVKSQSVYARTKTELNTSLQLLKEAIDEDEISRLWNFWGEDRELRETAERVTGGPACHKKLSLQINNFIKESTLCHWEGKS